ncbi:hypothetical protein RFI_12850 [Reticulomyxa filosa]|uniref:Uncharacterized protein n=1 Tax=Reticulomyxa filosa TaxID=46433 RepID=X6NEX0_RETFI|nr:hypothetical protein RFI_12850 [Reticulomyxa filosa]|eukprot:ETO24309.1 hypothetical protein RFI_12850 [Reticulomyxa filosa]
MELQKCVSWPSQKRYVPLAREYIHIYIYIYLDTTYNNKFMLFILLIGNAGQLLATVRGWNSDNQEHVDESKGDESYVSEINGAQLIRSPANGPLRKTTTNVPEYVPISKAQMTQDTAFITVNWNGQVQDLQNIQDNLGAVVNSLLAGVVPNSNQFIIYFTNKNTNTEKDSANTNSFTITINSNNPESVNNIINIFSNQQNQNDEIEN